RLARRLPRLQLSLFMGEVTSQQLSIATVVLVSTTDAFAIVAQAEAVDDVEPVPLGVSEGRNIHMIDARGSDSDGAARRDGLEPGLDRAAVSGQLEHFTRPCIADAQRLLGDIDSDNCNLACHDELRRRRWRSPVGAHNGAGLPVLSV